MIAGFLQAARVAGAVIDAPLVSTAWMRESALDQMTVGAVTGHLYLIVRRVDKHLDEPEPSATSMSSAGTYQWLRVERAEDLDRADHRAVRDDGHKVARWGWDAVATAYRERVEKLTARLADRTPRAVTVGDSVLDFESYLATRIVELLVHTDDLAVSVGMAPTAMPSDSVNVALQVLLDSARSTYGDLQVLRSLTRRERVQPPTPSVF